MLAKLTGNAPIDQPDSALLSTHPPFCETDKSWVDGGYVTVQIRP
jgi:hypothetical protein